MRQGLQVVPGLHVDDAVQVVLRWRAKDACTEERERQFFFFTTWLKIGPFSARPGITRQKLNQVKNSKKCICTACKNALKNNQTKIREDANVADRPANTKTTLGSTNSVNVL